jgi:hypothetical protein
MATRLAPYKGRFRVIANRFGLEMQRSEFPSRLPQHRAASPDLSKPQTDGGRAQTGALFPAPTLSARPPIR